MLHAHRSHHFFQDPLSSGSSYFCLQCVCVCIYIYIYIYIYIHIHMCYMRIEVITSFRLPSARDLPISAYNVCVCVHILYVCVYIHIQMRHMHIESITSFRLPSAREIPQMCVCENTYMYTYIQTHSHVYINQRTYIRVHIHTCSTLALRRTCSC